jgi:hypothetical protein
MAALIQVIKIRTNVARSSGKLPDVLVDHIAKVSATYRSVERDDHLIALDVVE